MAFVRPCTWKDIILTLSCLKRKNRINSSYIATVEVKLHRHLDGWDTISKIQRPSSGSTFPTSSTRFLSVELHTSFFTSFSLVVIYVTNQWIGVTPPSGWGSCSACLIILRSHSGQSWTEGAIFSSHLKCFWNAAAVNMHQLSIDERYHKLRFKFEIIVNQLLALLVPKKLSSHQTLKWLRPTLPCSQCAYCLILSMVYVSPPHVLPTYILVDILWPQAHRGLHRADIFSIIPMHVLS